MKTFKRPHQTDTMMKPTNKNLFLLLISLALILSTTFIACEGPAGPQGEQGSQGEQGEQGPKGDQGDQGEEGTANVMYSDWIDIGWEVIEPTFHQLGIEESRITQRFLTNGGIVLMFMREQQNNGVDVVFPLPILFGNFQFAFIVGAEQDRGIIIFSLNSIDQTPAIPDDLWEGKQIRYVLVPGGVNLKAKGLDWQDYEQVGQYFGIPD